MTLSMPAAYEKVLITFDTVIFVSSRTINFQDVNYSIFACFLVLGFVLDQGINHKRIQTGFSLRIRVRDLSYKL